MPYYIRSYEGQDEWVSKKWLAHMNLGSDIYMSFFGATKKEAEDKARKWYEDERKYMKRIDTTVKDEIDDGGWGNVGQSSEVNASDGWGSFVSKPVDGRSALAGKVWVVKHMQDGSKDKKRIDPAQLQEYESNGYVKGGPRS